MKLRSVIIMSVVALSASIAAAQDAPSIDQQLEQLRGQVAAERQLLEESRGRWSAELETLKQERAKAAAEVLQLELDRQQLTDSRADLEQQARGAADRRAELASRLASVQTSLAALAERLAIMLEETPGNAPATEAMRAAAATLRDDKADAAQTINAANQVLTTLAETHRRAGSVEVTQQTLWTADGTQQEAKLLSVGLVAFAYQLPDGRIGLALSSPLDAAGYRWTEQIPAEVAAQLRDVFASFEAGQATASVPLDPTGRMRVEAIQPDAGFMATIKAGGPVMIPIIALAVLAVLLMIERLFTLYVRNRGDDRSVARILTAARAGNIAEANAAAAKVSGTAGRVLAACLHRRAAGQHAMEDAIQEQLLHELPRLQRFLGALAVLAAVEPLLGLLGTVTGIIQTFGVIQAFGNANPALMAGGISEALITTAAGLIIAIPILLIHSMLRGRVDRIVADAEKHAATLLNLLSHEHKHDVEASIPGEEVAYADAR